MTVGELQKIIKTHNIPEDVIIKSDSGWEGSETDIGGMYYNEKEKLLILVQKCDEFNTWDSRYWEHRIKTYEAHPFLPSLECLKEKFEYYKSFKAIDI